MENGHDEIKNENDEVFENEENVETSDENETDYKDEICDEEERTVSELLAEQKHSYDDLFDKFQRNLAEFDNFRKRSEKEKLSSFDRGVGEAIEKLLPVLDNFERAVDSATDKEDSFFKGVDMILRQFKTAINDLGIEEIESVGLAFDHNLHFAVAHVDDEDYAENIVVEELQKGYKLNGKILRHSMVKVAN